MIIFCGDDFKNATTVTCVGIGDWSFGVVSDEFMSSLWLQATIYFICEVDNS